MTTVVWYFCPWMSTPSPAYSPSILAVSGSPTADGAVGANAHNETATTAARTGRVTAGSSGRGDVRRAMTGDPHPFGGRNAGLANTGFHGRRSHRTNTPAA